MKRIIPLVLAAMLLLGLAACAHAPEATVPPTAAPFSADDTPTDPPMEDDPKLGSYQDGTYTNSFLGIGCDLDEQWTIYGRKQLAQLNGITADAVDDESLADILRNSGVAHSFFALAEDGMVTLNITLEDLGLQYDAITDVAEYAKLSADQLPAALESAGLTDVTAEITTVPFAGTEHTAISIHATVNDMDFYEVMVYLKLDSYIAAITAASYYEDSTGELLSLFYPLEN